MPWTEPCCFIIIGPLSGEKILHRKIFFSRPVVRTRVFLTRLTCLFYGSRRNWPVVPCSRSRNRLSRFSAYGHERKSCLTWSLFRIFSLITRKITRIASLFFLNGGRKRRIKRYYPPRKKWMPCVFSRYINPRDWNSKRLLSLSVHGISMTLVTDVGYGVKTGRKDSGSWNTHR